MRKFLAPHYLFLFFLLLVAVVLFSSNFDFIKEKFKFNRYLNNNNLTNEEKKIATESLQNYAKNKDNDSIVIENNQIPHDKKVILSNDEKIGEGYLFDNNFTTDHGNNFSDSNNKQKDKVNIFKSIQNWFRKDIVQKTAQDDGNPLNNIAIKASDGWINSGIFMYNQTDNFGLYIGFGKVIENNIDYLLIDVGNNKQLQIKFNNNTAINYFYDNGKWKTLLDISTIKIGDVIGFRWQSNLKISDTNISNYSKFLTNNVLLINDIFYDPSYKVIWN